MSKSSLLMQEFINNGHMTLEYGDCISKLNGISNNINFVKTTYDYLRDLQGDMTVESFDNPTVSEYREKLNFLLTSLNETIEKSEENHEKLKESVNQLAEKSLELKKSREGGNQHDQ